MHVSNNQNVQGGLENAGCASGLYVNWWKNEVDAEKHKVDNLSMIDTNTNANTKTLQIQIQK